MKLSPSLASIGEVFESELHAAGGSVANRFEDGERLYLRGVLPVAGDVRPGDGIRGGVALRADEQCVLVHPYTFRQVCSNGAIMAHAIGTEAVERVEDSGLGCDGFEAIERVRQAVRVCADPAAFEAGISQMRAATQSEADMMITLMPMLSRMSAPMAVRLIVQISERLGPDRSRYGLMNAVTSTARDTADPELRWRLEEIGGAVAAGVVRPIPQRSAKLQVVAIA
jgi:hypothetical protein